jgi:hypothetical protein
VNVLRLIQVIRAGRGNSLPPLRAAAALGLDATGQVVINPAAGEAAPLGTLRPVGDAWFLLPASDGLLLNGTRPLPVAVVEPGDLLATGDETWFLASEWAAEPQAAPPELADRPCPVCGGELKLAPVVRCVCGRFAHLEDKSAPGDPQLLNCYLAGACGVCQRKPSLAPVLVPEPPEKLLDESAHEMAAGACTGRAQ